MKINGDEIKEILRAKGIKHIELARFCGMTKQGLSSLLGKTQSTSDETAQRISQFLGVPLRQILRYSDGENYITFNEAQELKEDSVRYKAKISELEEAIAEYKQFLKEKTAYINMLTDKLEELNKKKK